MQRLNRGVYTNPFLRFSWEAGHVSCSIVGTGLRSNLIQWCGWNQVRSNPCRGSGFITHSRKGCIQRKIWGLPLFLLFHHSPQSGPQWDTSGVSAVTIRDTKANITFKMITNSRTICAYSFQLLQWKYLSLPPCKVGLQWYQDPKLGSASGPLNNGKKRAYPFLPLSQAAWKPQFR